MRYVMKQKLWALGDDFMIKDAAGHDRFYVDGKAISLREAQLRERVRDEAFVRDGCGTPGVSWLKLHPPRIVQDAFISGAVGALRQHPCRPAHLCHSREAVFR